MRGSNLSLVTFCSFLRALRTLHHGSVLTSRIHLILGCRTSFLTLKLYYRWPRSIIAEIFCLLFILLFVFSFLFLMYLSMTRDCRRFFCQYSIIKVSNLYDIVFKICRLRSIFTTLSLVPSLFPSSFSTVVCMECFHIAIPFIALVSKVLSCNKVRLLSAYFSFIIIQFSLTIKEGLNPNC